jgi:type II secretory ATPase GspE/PulE/Tfp pilus assembly ATPase PilB-like protein
MNPEPGPSGRLPPATQPGCPQLDASGWARRLGWIDLGSSQSPTSADPGPLTADYLSANGLVPLRDENGACILATNDPLNFAAFDGIEALCDRPVAPAYLPALERSQKTAVSPGAGFQKAGAAEAFVANLISNAANRRAADIHIEPVGSGLRVRLRIDGHLEVTGAQIPQALGDSVVAHVKLLAGMQLDEHRLPQDGRFGFSGSDADTIELRASCIPSTKRESLVLRLLRPARAMPSVDELGLEPGDLRDLESLLALPDGLVLVTGPTGSGKTSTLYAGLARLNSQKRKIITVEDPVECVIPGVNQVPVRSALGMTYARALRSILRQAPNVIMIGEIRDPETASIALSAALTGYLVLSTLHTRDAAGTVARLLELDLPPALVASALRGVVAQRLVRRICETCRGSVHSEQTCPACMGRGFRGRIGIFELFLPDPAARDLIAGGAAASEIREFRRSARQVSLREDGERKITAGLTTREEVVSITDAGAIEHRGPRSSPNEERHEL